MKTAVAGAIAAVVLMVAGCLSSYHPEDVLRRDVDRAITQAQDVESLEARLRALGAICAGGQRANERVAVFPVKSRGHYREMTVVYSIEDGGKYRILSITVEAVAHS